MANWSELMKAELRNVRISGRIAFGSGAEIALDGDHISEITIDEGAEGALMPGDVLSAVCRADLVNDAGQWLPGGSCLGLQELIGATFMPELIVSDSEGEYTRPLGIFQVESAVFAEKEARMRITAADSISFELGGAFKDSLEYPATIADIWRHALSQTRYIWNGEVPNGDIMVDTAPDWGDISARQAIGIIAAAAGCFVHVDRTGSLRLARVWDENAEEMDIGPSSYLKLESDFSSFGPVDALFLTTAGEGAQERRYYATDEQSSVFPVSVRYNPLFPEGGAHTDVLARAMLLGIAGYRAESMRFDWRGDPETGIGQRVVVTDASGYRHEGVITRQSMKYSSGFSASCGCAIPENSVSGVMRAITPEGGLNAAALVGAVDGRLISAGSITTAKLAAGSVTAEKLAVGAMEAQMISAVAAKVSSLTAGDIQTDELAAALAAFTVITAGSAEFDRATVEHLVSDAMNLEFGAAEQLFIKNLSVEYAQMVGAAIGNLCIKASDGNYYAIDVDASGNVIASSAQVTEGEATSGQTESGRVILETDITAENLNASNLLATFALINKIDAARIDADTLFAREAFVNKLITSRIFADGGSLEIIAANSAEMRRWFEFDNDRGFIIRKPEYTDAQGTLHPASIWYTVTDETGYHIYNTQQTAPVGSFRRGGLHTTGIQVGDIVCKRTASGGWVWTDAE
ncbi:MAG: hypothetical protein IJA26_07530 [Clostridia bacterium]|nr:hypothetical protein [Clostridia bacterium]